MELLQCENLNIKKDWTRYSLYFDKYKYKATLNFPGIHYFRYEKSLASFNKRLDDVIAAPNFSSTNSNLYTVLSDLLTTKFGVDIQDFKNFIVWREKHLGNAMVSIHRDWLTVYFNDLEHWREFAQSCPQRYASLYYAIHDIKYQKGIIYHKNPQYKYRLYFKVSRIPDPEIAQFNKLLRTFDCKLSPSLYRELYTKRSRHWGYTLILDYYYIDINDDSIVTIWALTYPNLVRKLVNIEKR